MSKLQSFNFENQQVRTLSIDDQAYFVGKDVARILGYVNTRKAIQDHVDREDKKDGVEAFGRLDPVGQYQQNGRQDQPLDADRSGPAQTVEQ